jgi:hypothetical protein
MKGTRTMVTSNQNQADKQSPDKPSDDLNNLYIGHIDEVIGLSSVGEVSLKGEVLLYGQIEGGVFVVEQLRRLALYGALRKPDDERIGVISLAGPLIVPELVLDKDTKQSGSVRNLHLQCHYRALSLNESGSEKTNIFPRVEVLSADLTWTQVGEATEQAIQLVINIPTSNLVSQWPGLGLLDKITFVERKTLSFYPPGSESLTQKETHNSLHGCTEQPTSPCTGANLGRQLPLKFINISGMTDMGQLESRCQNQIKGACEVWRNKAALDLIVESDIEPGGDKGLITGDKVDNLRPSTFSHVNVYLVNDFEFPTNGACSCDGGQASAYCMLKWDVLSPEEDVETNKYLLAHELGHVLGITHPDGDNLIEFPPAAGMPNYHLGSHDSVMDPELISSRNTRQNMNIFTMWPSTSNPINNQTPLNAIVSATSWCDNFHPDP